MRKVSLGGFVVLGTLRSSRPGTSLAEPPAQVGGLPHRQVCIPSLTDTRDCVEFWVVHAVLLVGGGSLWKDLKDE